MFEFLMHSLCFFLVQDALSRASANANAQAAVESIQDDAQRLRNTEQSMTRMLQKVDAERANVEQAVADLERAGAAIDRDGLLELKRGGLPKQAALAGLFLFSVRSILDSAAAVSGADPSRWHCTGVCAGILFPVDVHVACVCVREFRLVWLFTAANEENWRQLNTIIYSYLR
jgi:hypothetical protein